MSEKNACSNRTSSSPEPMVQGAKTESCVGLPWLEGEGRERVCQPVVRLIVELERAARAELPVAERLSLLQDLKPKVVKISAQLPKSVVNPRHFDAVGAVGAVGQALEQRLDSLMAKNLKLALDDLGWSELASGGAPVQLRSWLVRNLFRFLGRQVEYAVRRNRPYPLGAWAMLHELYFDLGARQDLSCELAVLRGGYAFDPGSEYKRLLLFGLVGQLVPPAERSTQLFDALASSARESRLEHPASYSGAFDIFVVEIAQDGPPRASGALDYGFNGWVLEPDRKFLDLVGRSRT